MSKHVDFLCSHRVYLPLVTLSEVSLQVYGDFSKISGSKMYISHFDTLYSASNKVTTSL